MIKRNQYLCCFYSLPFSFKDQCSKRGLSFLFLHQTKKCLLDGSFVCFLVVAQCNYKYQSCSNQLPRERYDFKKSSFPFPDFTFLIQQRKQSVSAELVSCCFSSRTLLSPLQRKKGKRSDHKVSKQPSSISVSYIRHRCADFCEKSVKKKSSVF